MEPSHVQVILSTSNPCELSQLSLATSQEHARERFNHVINLMGTGPAHLRLSPNFEIEELTVEKLMRLFLLLDQSFYSATLFPQIDKKGVRLFVALFPFNSAKSEPSMKTVGISNNPDGILEEIQIFVNTNRYGKSAMYRTTNGIRAHCKLEALIISALHEITHAIQYVWCGTEIGHKESFLQLNHKIHGANRYVFEYRDDLPQVSQNL